MTQPWLCPLLAEMGFQINTLADDRDEVDRYVHPERPAKVNVWRNTEAWGGNGHVTGIWLNPTGETMNWREVTGVKSSLEFLALLGGVRHD